MGLISRPSTQHVSRPFPSSKKQVQTKPKQKLPDFPAIFVLMSQSKQECKEQNMDPQEVQELVLFSGLFYFPSPTSVKAIARQHAACCRETTTSTHALLRISFRGNQATPEPCLSRKKLEAQNVLHARLYLIILISLNPQSFSAVPAFLLCSILARHIGDKGKGQARGIVGTKEERCTYRVGHIQVNLAMSASNDMAPYHGIAPSNTHPTHDTLRHIGSKNR